MAKANYDRIAPCYDLLSRLVFGNAIDQANSYLVSFTPPHSTVLIIGGGTGKILQSLTTKHKSGLKILFVDSSAEMIRLAKGKYIAANQVTFVNDAIENVILPEVFDVVITPFLFDNFSNETSERVFLKTDLFLKSDGIWLYADFQTHNLWQQLLLKSMYLFFRLTSDVEARRLPDVSLLLKKKGYKIKHHSSFFANFISAAVYGRKI